MAEKNNKKKEQKTDSAEMINVIKENTTKISMINLLI
jgi:hypothetical protein